MRIEVLVPDENPVFYDLNKPRMVVGSDLECDIILTHSDVSRQHLTIVKEGEAYFVMDKGSTNGSYLNEERLIPGRRVEFNSFFPVRIGTDVLISLVSDEEGLGEALEKIEIPIPKSFADKGAPVRDEATRAISLKDLKEAKTEKLVKRRTEIKKSASVVDPKLAKTKTKKKPKFKMTPAHWVSLGIVLVALYFNNPFATKAVPVTEKVDDSPTVDESGRPIEKRTSKKVAPVAPVIQEDIFKTAGLPEKLLFFREEKKCQDEAAKNICERIYPQIVEPYGVFVETTVFIYIDATSYLEEARLVLMANQPGEPKSKNDWYTLAAFYLLVDGIKPMPASFFSGKPILIGLYLAADLAAPIAMIDVTADELERLHIVMKKRDLAAIGPEVGNKLDFAKSTVRLKIPDPKQ